MSVFPNAKSGIGKLTHKFIIDETWNAISGLSSEQINTIHVSTEELTIGRILIKVDGVDISDIGNSVTDTSFIIHPSSSVDIVSSSDGFDISTSVFLQSFSVTSQESTPNGVFFRSDGVKMYVVGSGNDSVHEYNLSTPWDISTSVFLQSFSVNSQDASTRDVFFKPDGVKMYVIGGGNHSVYEYDLSTPWDISTSVFLQSFSVNSQDAFPNGVFFKPDGVKMYVIGGGGDSVYEYDLSTPWDISTSVFLQSFSVTSQGLVPNGVFFKPDGVKMYVVGSDGDSVHEYDLSTPWDISTSVFLQSFSVSSQDSTPNGVFFKPDGVKMYVVGSGGDSVYEYDLSDIFTGTARVVIV